MKQIALIGYGYWGPNLLRNLFDTPGCQVNYVCDLSSKRLEAAKKRYPSIQVSLNIDEIIKNPKIDGVIIATPTRTHFPIAKKALLSGKHILIEKPMTMSLKEAKILIALGKKNKKVVMVDHTFLYNDAVLKIKKLIDKKILGKILYIDCVRANLGLFQTDVNVVFDLASHDFSIISFLLNSKPKFINATGKSHFNKQEDVAYITAQYPDDIMAHVHVSWLSPLKIRKMIVIGTKKMVVYDDIEPTEKIRVYDKGIIMDISSEEVVEQIKIGYRTGDALLPKIDVIEPLSLMLKDFIQAMSYKTHKTRSSGDFVLSIMEILQASNKSIRTGRKVTI